MKYKIKKKKKMNMKWNLNKSFYNKGKMKQDFFLK